MSTFERLHKAIYNRDRILSKSMQEIKDDFSQHGFLNIFEKELQDGIITGRFKTEELTMTVGKDDKNGLRVFDDTGSFTVQLVG